MDNTRVSSLADPPRPLQEGPGVSTPPTPTLVHQERSGECEKEHEETRSLRSVVVAVVRKVFLLLITPKYQPLYIHFSMRFVGDPLLPPQLARLHHPREEENIGVSLPHLQRLHLRPHCPHNATRGSSFMGQDGVVPEW
ncbi:hypothetical protein Pcinc_001795 [Petrolisthes cinctipes]|uniref:Uncharacterized protein n=1 Tax=Petrolisthes cinctipes TaxID=88211 RepID=A0AAE1GJG0_PETCI|nr:hypothetical protein Pcinc_001795 [Petrolisthes cinctipes]